MTDRTSTDIERMVITAARLIQDDAVLMVGTQWPIVVALLAKALHAPDSVICHEGGVVMGKLPERVPLFTVDPTLHSCSVLLGGSFDTLGAVLHAGRADMALLAAASIDRFGNINTTCFGDYGSPRVRLGGSGGGCDLGSLAEKTIIIMEHERRRFPEKVDFITTPGFLEGEGTREEAGLRPGTGPFAVVTTMGLFGFDEQGEMILLRYNPRFSIEDIRENVQWDLKVADDVGALKLPTKEELEMLRKRIDPQGMYLRGGRMLDGRDLET